MAPHAVRLRALNAQCGNEALHAPRSSPRAAPLSWKPPGARLPEGSQPPGESSFHRLRDPARRSKPKLGEQATLTTQLAPLRHRCLRALGTRTLRRRPALALASLWTQRRESTHNMWCKNGEAGPVLCGIQERHMAPSISLSLRAALSTSFCAASKRHGSKSVPGKIKNTTSTPRNLFLKTGICLL